jgi:hypothetical protein
LFRMLFNHLATADDFSAGPFTTRTPLLSMQQYHDDCPY